MPVERFYGDEAQTVSFTGMIDSGRGTATAGDGTTTRCSTAMRRRGGAPLTQLGFECGLRPPR